MDGEKVFARPNGKPYRPRRTALWAEAWDEGPGGDYGVIVFGALDPAQAARFASEISAHWYSNPKIDKAVPGWYRKAMRNGEPTWIEDEVRGAPGVMFTTEEA